jgi:LPXTG-motif cell wall-anchored protein
VDAKGNLYIVWDETGRGVAKRKAGVWYSYSTDRGKTWATPIRVDPGPGTDIWPWIAVGDPGRVAIAWFGAERELPRQDSETTGDYGWHVFAAQTVTGLGCGGFPPRFLAAQATKEPFHKGTVCAQGTVCQAQLIDRRLGDYFTIDIDTTGAMVAAYSDTRQEGAVALPAFIRQTGGPSFHTPKAAAAPNPKPAPKPAVGGTKQKPSLPATGAGTWFVLASMLLLASAALAAWRKRSV